MAEKNDAITHIHGLASLAGMAVGSDRLRQVAGEAQQLQKELDTVWHAIYRKQILEAAEAIQKGLSKEIGYELGYESKSDASQVVGARIHLGQAAAVQMELQATLRQAVLENVGIDFEEGASLESVRDVRNGMNCLCHHELGHDFLENTREDFSVKTFALHDFNTKLLPQKEVGHHAEEIVVDKIGFELARVHVHKFGDEPEGLNNESIATRADAILSKRILIEAQQGKRDDEGVVVLLARTEARLREKAKIVTLNEEVRSQALEVASNIRLFVGSLAQAQFEEYRKLVEAYAAHYASVSVKGFEASSVEKTLENIVEALKNAMGEKPIVARNARVFLEQVTLEDVARACKGEAVGKIDALALEIERARASGVQLKFEPEKAIEQIFALVKKRVEKKDAKAIEYAHLQAERKEYERTSAENAFIKDEKVLEVLLDDCEKGVEEGNAKAVGRIGILYAHCTGVNAANACKLLVKALGKQKTVLRALGVMCSIEDSESRSLQTQLTTLRRDERGDVTRAIFDALAEKEYAPTDNAVRLLRILHDEGANTLEIVYGEFGKIRSRVGKGIDDAKADELEERVLGLISRIDATQAVALAEQLVNERGMHRESCQTAVEFLSDDGEITSKARGQATQALLRLLEKCAPAKGRRGSQLYRDVLASLEAIGDGSIVPKLEELQAKFPKSYNRDFKETLEQLTLVAGSEQVRQAKGLMQLRGTARTGSAHEREAKKAMQSRGQAGKARATKKS